MYGSILRTGNASFRIEINNAAMNKLPKCQSNEHKVLGKFEQQNELFLASSIRVHTTHRENVQPVSYASAQYFGMMHKPIPLPEAKKIPAA